MLQPKRSLFLNRLALVRNGLHPGHGNDPRKRKDGVCRIGIQAIDVDADPSHKPLHQAELAQGGVEAPPDVLVICVSFVHTSNASAVVVAKLVALDGKRWLFGDNDVQKGLQHGNLVEALDHGTDVQRDVAHVRIYTGFCQSSQDLLVLSLRGLRGARSAPLLLRFAPTALSRALGWRILIRSRRVRAIRRGRHRALLPTLRGGDSGGRQLLGGHASRRFECQLRQVRRPIRGTEHAAVELFREAAQYRRESSANVVQDGAGGRPEPTEQSSHDIDGLLLHHFLHCAVLLHGHEENRGPVAEDDRLVQVVHGFWSPQEAKTGQRGNQGRQGQLTLLSIRLARSLGAEGKRGRIRRHSRDEGHEVETPELLLQRPSHVRRHHRLLQVEQLGEKLLCSFVPPPPILQLKIPSGLWIRAGGLLLPILAVRLPICVLMEERRRIRVVGAKVFDVVKLV
mmetsp:Transcript_17055/g.65034  ORF Transcript_17055/g.65034 Transcript_17055/m.65034 type:complete len:454 (+) Transcript_17055:796-2157(+)